MKRMLAVLFLLAALSGLAMAQSEPERFGQREGSRFPAGCTTQGWNLVDNTSCVATTSAAFVDASVFSGADYCAKIANAIASLTLPTSATIDARGLTGASTCSGATANPFASASNLTGQLLLGSVVITTPTQWTIPNRFWIRGIGLASGSSAVNSVIQASSGSLTCTTTLSLNSNTYCPLVFIGPVTQDVFAAGVSNLTIDCNSNTDCIGVGSAQVQEGGGIDSVSLINQLVACVDFDATARTTASGISNSFMRNVNCTLPNASNGSVSFTGIVLYATDGIAEISNVSVTVPGAGTNGSSINGPCVQVNAAYGLTVNYLHCEHAANGIIIGPATNNTTNPTTAVSVRGVTTGNMTNSASNSVVLIQNASQVTVHGVALSPTTSSVKSIHDKVNNVSLADPLVGLYAMSTDGGVLISTSSSTPWVLPATPSTGLTTGNYSTAPAGSLAYCTNCAVGNCSTSSGPGALAVHTSSAWVCK